MSNNLKVDDKVNSVYDLLKKNGIVKYIACKNATAAIKTCDKKKCNCPVKDYVWVEWPEPINKVYSYAYTELVRVVHLEKPKDIPQSAEVKAAVENIKETIATQKNMDDFWKRYNGYTKIRRDRQGRVFETDDDPKQVVIKDLTPEFWNNYNGIKEQ